MREIKFRAWDVRNKIMYMVSALSFRSNYDIFRVYGEHHGKDEFHVENPDDTYLMQFTGLTDQNGKDIYEGDKMGSGIVKYMNGAFKLIGPEWEHCMKFASNNYIVSGNIHENPELLGEK